MNTQSHAEPKTAVVSKNGERELRIERTFDAPRERVWKAMTDPKLLAQWWGRGNRLTVETYELERGGHWRFVEHTPDGKSHGFEGRFREIVPQSKLSMTFDWDGMPGHPVIITNVFEEIDGGKRTRLVGTSLFITQAELDGMVKSGMETGMNQSYRALDRVLAAQ